MSLTSKVFAFNSLSSLVFGSLLIFKPQLGWKLLNVKSSVSTSVVSIVYGCVVIGEFFLFGCASLEPQIYGPGALAFLIPYKSASAFALLYWSFYKKAISKRDGLIVSIEWLAPMFLTIAALNYDNRTSTIIGKTL